MQATVAALLAIWAYQASAFSVPSTQRIVGKHANAARRGFHVKASASSITELYQPPVRANEHAKVQPQPAASVAKDSFDWSKQWYPIGVAEFLDQKRPHSVTLLGKEYVLWYSTATQGWNVFADACPHRLAPLSEGRIEADGTLLCAYHAWRFGEGGACKNIPQSTAEASSRHTSDPKACATAFPVTVRQGLIFMWPESGLQAAAEASQAEPALVPELDDPELIAAKRVKGLPLNTRDLPYGYEAFFENILDVAHVVVSHHNLVGNRYKDAQPVSITPERSLTPQGGFKVQVNSVMAPSTAKTSMDWRPPGHLKIETAYEDGSKGILSLYAVPSTPGRCLHIGQQVIVSNKEGKGAPGLKVFSLPLPVWLQHGLASLFLHQDMVLLHHQQRLLQQAEVTAANFNRKIYTPNGQDSSILPFKAWLATMTNGGIPWPKGISTVMPKLPADQLFDVYHTHTKNCKVCSTAVKNLKRAVYALRTTSVLLLVKGLVQYSMQTAAVAAAASSSATVLPLATSVVGASLLFGMSVATSMFRQVYYKYEFAHQDNN